MKKANASCPASISFIFRICHNNDPVKTGSVGVGCTVDREVEVSVGKSEFNKVIFDGATINFPTVHSVVKKLATVPVCVSISSALPLGYGFGISSASALSTAFALNKLFNLKKSELELAQIAHIAEIENYTGLGSVATQITGGFLVKNKPGLPVDAYSLPFVGKKLYVVIIDRLETPTVLHNKNRLEKINNAADLALDKIRKRENISLEEIIDISYEFANKSGVIKNREVERIIDGIRREGSSATISMLGYIVITTRKLDKIKDYPVKELVISDKTVNYL